MNKINTRLIAIIMLSLPAVISATGTNEQIASSSGIKSTNLPKSKLIRYTEGTLQSDLIACKTIYDKNRKRSNSFLITGSQTVIFNLAKQSVKTNDSAERAKLQSQYQNKIRQLPEYQQAKIRQKVAEAKDKLMKEKARKNK